MRPSSLRFFSKLTHSFTHRKTLLLPSLQSSKSLFKFTHRYLATDKVTKTDKDAPNDPQKNKEHSRMFVAGPSTLVEREIYVESMTPKKKL